MLVQNRKGRKLPCSGNVNCNWKRIAVCKLFHELTGKLLVLMKCNGLSLLHFVIVHLHYHYFFMHITVAAMRAARNITSESSLIGDVKENVLRICNCEQKILLLCCQAMLEIVWTGQIQSCI